MLATIVQAQPQYTAQINWGNPLTTNLVHAGTPVNSAFDAVGKVNFSNVTKPLIKLGRSGLAWLPVPYSSYVTYDYLGKAPPGSVTPYQNDDQTVLWVVSCEYWSTFTGPYSVVRGPGGGDNASNSLLINSNGEICYGTPNVFAVNSGVKIPLQKTSVIVFTSNAAGSTIYLDGKVIGYSATRIPFDDGYYNTINRLGYADSSGTVVNIDGTQAYPYYTYAVAQWNKRCFSNTEVINLSQNPWQLFKAVSTTNLNQIYYKFDSPTVIAAAPAQQFVAPVIRIRPANTNLVDIPQVNPQNPIARNLTNVLVYARLGPHTTTSIKFDNSQITHHGPDNPVSNPALRRVVDQKYGAYNRIWDNNPGFISNINTFTTFLTTDKVTFLDVFKVESTTRVISAYERLQLNSGNNNIGTLAYQLQSTGTVSQIRIVQYPNTSSWVTIPRDEILRVVLTHDPAVGQKLYVNGVLAVERNVPGNLGGNTQYLWKNHGGYYGSFDSHRDSNYFSAAWKRALTDIEIRSISENPLQLLKPKTTQLAASTYPEPVQKAPVIRITPATSNYQKYPTINVGHPLARELYNILVFGRENQSAALTTSIGLNSQISAGGPGNSASWDKLTRDYDSKYGAFAKLNSYSTDTTNVSAFNSFSGTKGATLLLTARFNSSTTILNGSNGVTKVLAIGSGYNGGFGTAVQNTGTELQIRVGKRGGLQPGNLYNINSSWVPLPTDRIVQIVCTTQVGVGEKLYIDGKLVATQTADVSDNYIYLNGYSTLVIDWPSLWAASNIPKPQYYFGASWGRALSDTEIREISNNPLQLLRPQKQIHYLTTETPQPQPLIGGKYRYTTNSQPQKSGTVNRNSKLGREITFLWSGANPSYDYAQNLSVGAGANHQSVLRRATEFGTGLTVTSGGAIEWLLYDVASSNYTTGPGILRQNTNAWTQGVIFQRRSLSANTTVMNVTNGGSWNHRIGTDANGFVVVKNAEATSVQLTSDQVYPNNSWIKVVLVHKAGGTRFYVNGVLQTQVATGLIATTGLDRVMFGFGVPVIVLTAFVSNREWTQTDVTSWTENPWQLFQPESRDFYTTMPSGVVVPSTARNRFLFFFN
jgi:hypothetical protein